MGGVLYLDELTLMKWANPVSLQVSDTLQSMQRLHYRQEGATSPHSVAANIQRMDISSQDHAHIPTVQ